MNAFTLLALCCSPTVCPYSWSATIPSSEDALYTMPSLLGEEYPRSGR